MEGIVWESVWVAVGFAVFVALVWKKVGSALGSMLDDRSAKIKADLDEARTLREEALDELHQFQRLHREAAEEAKAILRNAEAAAERSARTPRPQPRKRSSAASSRRRQRSRRRNCNDQRAPRQGGKPRGGVGSADHFLKARRQGRLGACRRRRRGNRETELGAGAGRRPSYPLLPANRLVITAPEAG